MFNNDHSFVPFRKLVHAIYRDFLCYKNEIKLEKMLDFSYIFVKNIDCGRKLKLASIYVLENILQQHNSLAFVAGLKGLLMRVGSSPENAQ